MTHSKHWIFLDSYLRPVGRWRRGSRAARVGGAAAAVHRNSVVKVFSTMRYPDPFKPWTKQAPAEITASGVVIEGKRILTNAHVVLYASQVQIQANAPATRCRPPSSRWRRASIWRCCSSTTRASSTRIRRGARQQAAAHQGRGARLRLSHRRQFPVHHQGHRVAHRIRAYNYPVSGLRIQVDAAINPGNSGGPAIAGDKMIGLAFSKLSAAMRRTSATSFPTRKWSCF
jgi:hypothetical protein